MTNLTDAKLIYKGGGYLAGVPARDMTRDEAAALGLDIPTLLKSGLYEIELSKPKRSTKKEEPELEQVKEVNNGRWN